MDNTYLLQGLRVLNTRPKQQASSLTQAIEEAGGLSINLPLLDIKPTETRWKNKCSRLEIYQAAIFTSPNAVHYFFAEILPDTWPNKTTIFAIGQGTTHALIQQGVPAPTYPKQADSEHLLKLEALQDIKNHNILLIKGLNGRALIHTTLAARGAYVSILDVYQRALPQHHQKRTQTLWHEDAVDIILITSETALVHLFSLFDEQAHAWLRSKPYLVISERLRQAARARGIHTIMVCSYDHIIHQLHSYLSS